MNTWRNVSGHRVREKCVPVCTPRETWSVSYHSYLHSTTSVLHDIPHCLILVPPLVEQNGLWTELDLTE